MFSSFRFFHYGRQHEANHLSDLREQGKEGICLEDGTRTADLLQAMEAGPDFIFMQRIDAIRQTYPDMHVYHFHSYEPSALKRLSGRYAIHQELLDTLLREERFVDLPRIVRQTLRASVESYSIKELEPFFGYEREIDLRTAGDARHQLESWLEFNNPIDAAPEDQVNLVIDYNKDDCIATWRLRQWLEGIHREFHRGRQ